MTIARLARGFGAPAILSGIAAWATLSCLERPAVRGEPTTKTSFESNVRTVAVDKIDLVLSVDNSASMGDKQKFLAKAVPLLVNRLVTPRCVPKGQGVPDDAKQCAGGEDIEFHPIEDIHVAVVTSSLGGMGSDSLCKPAQGRQYDDRGVPIVRALDPNAAPVEVRTETGGFLAWLPPSEKNAKKPPAANPYADKKNLGDAISNLVRGAGERGCGFEAQLESVYRFLVQPDPWESITVERGKARYTGIANDVLAARKAFLRPDSLVAVIMLTDEDDSSVDPLSLGGSGWAYGNEDFPADAAPEDIRRSPGRVRQGGGGTTAPRGTSICATDPRSPDCTSCGYQYVCDAKDAACRKIKQDPNCIDNGGYHAPSSDPINVRFHRMKQRFGVDPQYPLKRYVAGFSAPVVPHRLGEHDAGGNYIGETNGLSGCTNPLFAKTLPSSALALTDATSLSAADKAGKLDWCKLPRGDRDAGLVFLAVVGGVPNELLHFNPESREASELSEEDWTKIVGKDLATYDDTGLDVRMLQSTSPRAGRRDAAPDAPSSDPLNKDHRDWNTGGADLQYACTFPLPQDMQRVRTNANAESFDCLTNSDAPLCNGDKTSANRTQVRGKAYPTLRELGVARLLGPQGIAASLCPQQSEGADDDPLFGYNPAVASIVGRLIDKLNAQCLPRPLKRDEKGRVTCLMVEELSEDDHRACKDVTARERLPTDIEGAYRAAHAESKGRTLCKLPQLTVPEGQNCRFREPGWCYASKSGDKNPVRRCSQAIVFSDAALETAKGAKVHLQCIDQAGAGVDK